MGASSYVAEQLVSEYRLVDGTNPRLRFSTQNVVSAEEETMKRAVKEEVDGQNGMVGFWG